MSAEPHGAAETEQEEENEAKVTSLELFFDLVFVFAVTQVTATLAADGSLIGAARGLLVLAAIWWAWVAYAWLTNNANADRIGVRISLLAAMVAMLLVSLSVPSAFGAAAVTFAIALFAVRLIHLVLYYLAAPNPETRGAVRMLAPGILLGGTILLVASRTTGLVQIGLWTLALALDYAAPLLGGGRGWSLSPAHFAERHGLIVIIALGEAVISLGVGAAGLPLDGTLIACAVMGLLGAASLWWLYFDRSVFFGEHRMRQLHGQERVVMARNSYSYLHLPIIMGVVLYALGSKKTLAHANEHLHGLAAVGLGLGPALVLVTLSILRKRHVGRHNRLRVAAGALCLTGVALGLYVSALAGMAAVAGVLTSLVALEEILSRRLRERAERDGWSLPVQRR